MIIILAILAALAVFFSGCYGKSPVRCETQAADKQHRDFCTKTPVGMIIWSTISLATLL